MAVTQEDIAEKLGVSRRLVGYALSGHPAINEVTREKIQNAAKEMGYRPHRVAQALASGKTHQIALCFPLLGSSYFNEMVRQFQMLARRSAYNLLTTCFNPADPDRENIGFTVDGMIFFGRMTGPPESQSHPVVALQNESRFPLLPAEEKHDRVQLNIQGAAIDAMSHLLSRGYRKIAYAAADGMLDEYECRYHAYQSAMRHAGLPSETIALPIPAEELIRQQSHQSLKEYFQGHGIPQALFCSNDDTAIGAYRALDELGYNVPGDVAIMGFDDLDDARYLKPPMSTVHMPIEAACNAAWQMLMRRIEDAGLPPSYQSFDAQLVVRESTTAKS